MNAAGRNCCNNNRKNSTVNNFKEYSMYRPKQNMQAGETFENNKHTRLFFGTLEYSMIHWENAKKKSLVWFSTCTSPLSYL